MLNKTALKRINKAIKTATKRERKLQGKEVKFKSVQVRFVRG